MEKADLKPWRDAKTLQWAYHKRGLTAREVGSLLGTSKNTVLYWLKKHNIERRPGPNRTGPWRDEDVLRREYVGNQRSINDLSEAWGASTATIHRWLKRFGIETRSRSAASGKDHWNWQDNPDPNPRECPQCGKTHTPSDGRSQLCSNDCKARWLQNRITVTCEQCDGEFEVVESRKETARFCSRECLGYWRSGERSPQWKGGKKPYGPGWTRKKRRAVRKRDGRKCVDCGLTNEDHKHRFDERLHVHHIRPARDFEDAEKRNAMPNLVTLCRNCHRKWEGLPMDVRTK